MFEKSLTPGTQGHSGSGKRSPKTMKALLLGGYAVTGWAMTTIASLFSKINCCYKAA